MLDFLILDLRQQLNTWPTDAVLECLSMNIETILLWNCIYIICLYLYWLRIIDITSFEQIVCFRSMTCTVNCCKHEINISKQKHGGGAVNIDLWAAISIPSRLFPVSFLYPGTKHEDSWLSCLSICQVAYYNWIQQIVPDPHRPLHEIKLSIFPFLRQNHLSLYMLYF